MRGTPAASAFSVMVLFNLTAVVHTACRSTAREFQEPVGADGEPFQVSFLQVELALNMSTVHMLPPEEHARLPVRRNPPTQQEFAADVMYREPADGSDMLPSERLYASPVNRDVKIWVIIATCCGAFSAIAALVLMWRHYQAGVELTVISTMPHARAMAVIELVAGIPCFACLSVASIFFLELQPVWYMFETLVLCYAAAKMTKYFENAAGGSAQIDQALQAGTFTEPENLRSKFPCCCLGLFLRPPRVPVPDDYLTLRFRVMVFFYGVPFVSCFIMAIEQRRIIAGLTDISPFVTLCGFLVKILLFTGKSGISGLAAIVELMNKSLYDDLKLGSALSFSTCYLLGMNLIPKMFLLLPEAWLPCRTLDNGYEFEHWEQGVFVSGAATCFASVLCTVLAWQAFPVDEFHYPELFSSAADRSLKPKRDRVLYCPFCGADDLVVESGASKPTPMEVAACLKCRSHSIPLQLEVMRPTLGGSAAAGATVPRAP